MATRNLTCTGLFGRKEQVDAVIDELRGLGVSRHDLLIALPKGHTFEPPREEHGGGLKRAADKLVPSDEKEAKEEGGAGLSWLLATAGAAVVNPILSPVIIPGALAAGVMAKVADAVMPEEDQTVSVTLRKRGMAEVEARYHEDRVNDGAYLVVVDNCDRLDADRVREIMLRHGAEDRAGHPVQDAAQAFHGTTHLSH
jgi:hypothetical protein